MLPLQISDRSCGLGSLGGKMIHTFTLTSITEYSRPHPQALLLHPKILQQKGWMAGSKWMISQGLICITADDAMCTWSRWKQESNMVRIVHPAPILAVLLVIAIALFSRLFFYSVRNQAITVLFFNKYQTKTNFYLSHTSCKRTPVQDVAQCADLESGSSLLAENEE